MYQTFIYNNSNCRYEPTNYSRILLNLCYISTSCQIPLLVLSIRFPDAAVSICVEIDSIAVHGLPFYDKAFGQ